MEWWIRPCEEKFNPIKIFSQGLELIAVVKTTRAIGTMKVNLIDASLVGSFRGDGGFGLVIGVGVSTSSSCCEWQMFKDFLHIGITEILGFLDNFEEGFIEDDMRSNSQVKDIKIDLLVQQYEQFTTLEEESIDSGFARFNTIITSLKALDKELKDVSSLVLDEIIGNLKVHEVVMEKDSKIYKGKKERVKSNALIAKKESSDDETSTSESDDEEYAMAVRNFKKFFRRKGRFVRQPREEKKSFRQRDDKKGKRDRK
ncbi:hypothetical protein Tco_0329264 [Tanacetum coccineum]